MKKSPYEFSKQLLFKIIYLNISNKGLKILYYYK